MRKNWLGRYATRVAMVAVAALLVVAVLILMHFVQNLLSSDVKINLTEVVTQNKDVITSRLNLEVNNLETTATQVSDRIAMSQGNKENVTGAFLQYGEANDTEDLYIATADGVATFPDGSSVEIAGRRYFQIAKEGTPNISERIISRITGEEMFVISVPVKLGQEVIGTLQREYTPEQMYSICELSLFSSQGSMTIITSDGYVVISTSDQGYSQESENYYRDLYASGNQDAAKQLESDVKSMQAGFMETLENDESIFSAYTALENVHDWYLITSVSTEAVSPNAQIVVSLFYGILLLVVLAFVVCMVLFMWNKGRQQKSLERAAFVDSVTGGNTFTRFALNIEQAFESNPQTQYYLFSFDIDNFKYINSFYGFDFGDAVLKTMYENVSKCLMPGEYLGRNSGDRFVALLKDANDERLALLVDAAPRNIDAQIYISAGIYKIENSDETISLMVDKASTAALYSKDALRKRVQWYSKESDEQLAHNEQMKRAVELAMAADEFVAYYQPKVNIETGKLVGAEALVRWKKEDGSLVSPAEFIPLSEKTGLVVDIDMLVLTHVLKFLRSNIEAGVECVPISVNFSRLHLYNDGFLDKVVEKLEQYQVPPNLIELELTESVIFDSPETIIAFVRGVHERGLLISMDDFGSGYSSLNMLKDLPIDVLKIDQGFLRETEDSERLSIIFGSIVEMAHKLKIRIVVEGVETTDNVELMRRNDCLVAQGYFYARPMDEDSFEGLFRKGQLWQEN